MRATETKKEPVLVVKPGEEGFLVQLFGEDDACEVSGSAAEQTWSTTYCGGLLRLR